MAAGRGVGSHSKDITAVLQNLVRDGLVTKQKQKQKQKPKQKPKPKPKPKPKQASYRLAEALPNQMATPAKAPPHLTPELLSLTELARFEATLPAMQALVLRLCEACWLTAKDLAALLSRDAENLQGRILSGLVKKGLLELRFPDGPNRAD